MFERKVTYGPRSQNFGYIFTFSSTTVNKPLGEPLSNCLLTHLPQRTAEQRSPISNVLSASSVTLVDVQQVLLVSHCTPLGSLLLCSEYFLACTAEATTTLIKASQRASQDSVDNVFFDCCILISSSSVIVAKRRTTNKALSTNTQAGVEVVSYSRGLCLMRQAAMASKEPEKTTRSSANDSSQPPTDVPWYRQLLAIKNTLIIIITPLLFLPLVVAYPTPVGIG